MQRKVFSAELKAKVALEALGGCKTVNAIAGAYEVHPHQVATWKREAQEGLNRRGGKMAKFILNPPNPTPMEPVDKPRYNVAIRLNDYQSNFGSPARCSDSPLFNSLTY